MNEYDKTKYKGIIPCPVPTCKAKTFVEIGTTGKASHPCKCGHLIKLDYDKMTAKEIKPIRGVLKDFSKKIAL